MEAPLEFTTQEIERLRFETPGCAERIHLNNAGASLMPRSVLCAVTEHLELESRIGGYEAAEAREKEIAQAYEDVGSLLGCPGANVAMVENATVAYQQALSSIPFEPGDVILTSQNDYISNQIMFLSLKKRLGVDVVRAPESLESGVDVTAFSSLLKKHKPVLVAITHVPTNSGLVQPVEEIGKHCREAGVWYLVDGCQSVGQMPVDVDRIGCDFLSATSRKFLRGPRGTGFLFASDRVLRAGLEPMFLDMRGARWVAADRYEHVAGAQRFENWEFAHALVLGTGAAVRYASDIGLERVEARTSKLAATLRQLLEKRGYRVLDRGRKKCGIVTVAIPVKDPDHFHSTLEARGVNTSISRREFAVIDFAEKGVEWALRLSPHYYNTEPELERAVQLISEVARP